MSCTVSSNPKRVAIIGAGPIGLEAAVYASTLGHDVQVFERGDIATNVRKWAFVSLFSPWSKSTTPLGIAQLSQQGWPKPNLQDRPSGGEFADSYLVPLANTPGLSGRIHARSQVLAVSRQESIDPECHDETDSRQPQEFRLLVREAHDRERVHLADVVIDCSGVYTNHRWAGRGGIPAPGERAAADRIRYTLPDLLGADRSRYAGRHTLILGCGFSAATVLRSFARLAEQQPSGTRVTWAIRRSGQAIQGIVNDPLDSRREVVEQVMRLTRQPPPWLQFVGHCVLETVGTGDPLPLTLNCDGLDMAMTVDEVLALVGYAADASIYEQLRLDESSDAAGQTQLAARLLGSSPAASLNRDAGLSAASTRTPEPGFFILGAKSYGTSGNFMLSVGHAQIRDAFRRIESDPTLDLYAEGVDAAAASATG